MPENNNGKLKMKELETWQTVLLQDIKEIKAALKTVCDQTTTNSTYITVQWGILAAILGGLMALAFFVIRSSLI